MLTCYDDRAISYDSIGNPLSDGKRTYTWEHGRELATVTQDGSTWTNTYGADGLRTKRTDGTTTYRYRYTAGQLATMNIDDDVEMWFMYDDNGPLVIKYGNAESHKVYHYELNLQGDIIAIVSTTGERVVEYTYDAWGNVLSITGSAANTIGVNNPLRYRGYIYDPETQLYYCQSRYYNPEVGRFINADAFTSTGQGLLGNNMFAYCGNDPVNYLDLSGNDSIAIQETQAWWISVMGWLCAIDGPIPVGDIIYIGGVLILGAVVLSVSEDTLPEISSDEGDNQPETEPPDVTYPGDDPTKAPDGYEWRGPDPQGGEKGGYANTNGKDSWHPDLDHPDGIGPHWDYNDGVGHKWRVYPTWIEFVK